MRISELTPMKMLALQEAIAKAIAKVDGYNFDSVDLAQYAQVNSRAAGYMEKAQAALRTIKEQSIY